MMENKPEYVCWWLAMVLTPDLLQGFREQQDVCTERCQDEIGLSMLFHSIPYSDEISVVRKNAVDTRSIRSRGILVGAL